MKKLLVGMVFVVLAIAGYWGVTRYQRYRFIEAISPHVKNTSLRLANASRFETEEATKITFKEVFEKLESDIGEIDKRILEVQTIAPPSRKEVTESALEYMRDTQDLLRALLAKFRGRLAVNTAFDRTDKAFDDWKSANPSSFDYDEKASEKALKDLEQVMMERKQSEASFLSTVKTLKPALARVSAFLPSDVLVDPAILDAIEKKNERGAKEQPPAEAARPAPASAAVAGSAGNCKTFGDGKCCSPDVTVHLTKEAVFSACGQTEATFLGEAASKDTCNYYFKIAGENSEETFVQVSAPAVKEVPDQPTNPFISFRKVGKVWMTDKANAPKAAMQVAATTELYMPGRGYFVSVTASNKVCSKPQVATLSKALK